MGEELHKNRALVMRSAGLWYDLQDEAGNILKGRLRGVFKKHKHKLTNPLAVGDYVHFEIEDVEERTALITKILPRENYVIRESTHKKTHGHIIAANIDQALLVATLVLPRTSLGFIDRFLVSTESFGIPTLILFNKMDVLGEDGLEIQEELSELYENLGYECLSISAVEGTSFDQLQEKIKGKTSLLAGHSGVGKSTILNRLDSNIDQKTAEISSFAQKGKHTTTFAEMFVLTDSAFVIDTPGIKEFGILDIENQELGFFFPEIRAVMNECKYHNCSHTHEPGCLVKEMVGSGEIAESRYISYLSILENEDNRR